LEAELTYSQTLKKSLPAFILGRMVPTLGVSAVFVLMAHKSPHDLAVFAYVLAVASVISGFFALALATAGNKVASLTSSDAAQREIFSGGVTLAVCLGALSCVASLLVTFILTNTASIGQLDKQVFWRLSLLYMSSMPLLVLNSFLQLFLEATGKASSYANARTCITALCSGLLALLFVVAGTEAFKYWAMSYFLISELLTFTFLIRLCGDQRYFSWAHAKETSAYFIRTGVPIAAGMSGQKLYFYLLTERLARIDAHLVAELSVFMTVVGLLIIPSLAFAQIHGLQVSRRPEYSKAYFRAGLIWLVGGSLLISAALCFAGEFVFSFAGGAVIDYSDRLILTLIIFLASNSLLALAFGQLRALGDTFVPQLLINLIMLALLTPAFYIIKFSAADLTDFLLFQSAAAFAGFLMLNVRIRALHRRMLTPPHAAPADTPMPYTEGRH
jgi:hypothetical protein